MPEKGKREVIVTVLAVEGCQSGPVTLNLVESVVRDTNIPVSIHYVVVHSPEEAVEQRFLGSPTVQVNGLDINPASRSQTTFGLG